MLVLHKLQDSLELIEPPEFVPFMWIYGFYLYIDKGDIWLKNTHSVYFIKEKLGVFLSVDSALASAHVLLQPWLPNKLSS